MASDDPEFESKAADIIGLYLRPPQHLKGLFQQPQAIPLIGQSPQEQLRDGAALVLTRLHCRARGE